MTVLSLLRNPAVAATIDRCLGPTSSGRRVVHADPDAVIAVKHVDDILNGGHERVLLPLTLPNYSALRLAERARQSRARIQLALVTTSNTDDIGATALLFGNRFVPTECASAAIAELKPLPALDDQTMRSCIGRILSSASCFRIGSDYSGRHPELARPSTLADYDLAAHFAIADFTAIAAHDLSERANHETHQLMRQRLSRTETVAALERSSNLVKEDQLSLFKALHDVLSLQRTVLDGIAAQTEAKELSDFLRDLRTWEQRLSGAAAKVATDAAIDTALTASGAAALG
jgi:hypothetical protein